MLVTSTMLRRSCCRNTISVWWASNKFFIFMQTNHLSSSCCRWIWVCGGSNFIIIKEDDLYMIESNMMLVSWWLCHGSLHLWCERFVFFYETDSTWILTWILCFCVWMLGSFAIMWHSILSFGSWLCSSCSCTVRKAKSRSNIVLQHVIENTKMPVALNIWLGLGLFVARKKEYVN